MGSAMKATRFSSVIYVCLLLVPAWAQQRDIEDYQPPLIEQLEATEVGRYHAQEARQGAAADADHIYAIVNFIIGQYDKTSGKLIQRWQGSRGGPIRHLNSCFAENRKLYCANSNFPEVPMASSIEVFDTGTLKHRQSLSLGILDEGSLTWFDRLDDGWLAGFAHYDADGGLSYKDHRFLYLTGHDRPEMYVLAAPAMGPKLEHVATIAIDVEGQAFAWDKSEERVVVGISRPNSEVRAFTVPEVQLPEGLKRLTEVNFSL